MRPTLDRKLYEDRNPTLPEPCKCDRPTVEDDRCLKCGRSVIAAIVSVQADEYRHGDQWPQRTACERCGAPVLRARHHGPGRPAILDVQETAGYRSAEVYLDAAGIARTAPGGFYGRRSGDAGHSRHRCPGQRVMRVAVDDGPNLLALAAAVGPPLADRKLHRGPKRVAPPPDPTLDREFAAAMKRHVERRAA